MIAAVKRNKQAILAECADLAPTVSSHPFYYAIHLNKPCNQKCIMCRPTGEFPADILPLADFRRLFASIRDYAEHITLIGGEPLMYPWIDDVLEQLAGCDIDVTMNTNATLLTPRVTSLLLSLHRLNLKVSIDGATRETFWRIRGTDTHELVTRNVERFSVAAAGRENSATWSCARTLRMSCRSSSTPAPCLISIASNSSRYAISGRGTSATVPGGRSTGAFSRSNRSGTITTP
jgi:hypothetical protein